MLAHPLGHRIGARANPSRPYRSRSRFRAINRTSLVWTVYRKSDPIPYVTTVYRPLCHRVSLPLFFIRQSRSCVRAYIYLKFFTTCVFDLFRSEKNVRYIDSVRFSW